MSNRMRRNRFRELLEAKPVLYGALLVVPSPRLVEFCGYAGFDWVFIDGEHDLVDLRACYELCTAADAAGVAVMARVSGNRAELLMGFADAGAHAVLVPHVLSVHAAQDAVAALRYPPDGTRGVHSGTRSANYGLTQSAVDYYAARQEHALPAAMLEDVEAFEALDGISEVDGLDLFMIGPGDLAASMGFPGQMDHPDVRAMASKVAKVLVSKGKTVTMLAPTPESAEVCVQLGARLILAPTDGLLGAALTGYLSTARSLCEGDG